MRSIAVWLALVALASGCASEYSWSSDVPAEMRTVSVPVFRNESDVTELGNVASRQLLREFQREGTFKIARVGEGAVEIQGIMKSASARHSGYDRRTGMRFVNYDMTATAEISVINKKNGKVMVDNKSYTARTSFVYNGDFLTSRRDASGRLAEDLARQVVDDVLSLKW